MEDFDYLYENIEPDILKIHRRSHKVQMNLNSKNRNNHLKCQSDKNNLVHQSEKNENLSLKKESKSNYIDILDPNYKKELFEKFYNFLDKKKFKLSNNFNEKNSKKFLDKKNKCLERIILSDIIEDVNDKEEKSNFLGLNNNDEEHIEFKTQKSPDKYFIIISNYDEEKKIKNTPKKKKRLNSSNNSIEKNRIYNF